MFGFGVVDALVHLFERAVEIVTLRLSADVLVRRCVGPLAILDLLHDFLVVKANVPGLVVVLNRHALNLLVHCWVPLLSAFHLLEM